MQNVPKIVLDLLKASPPPVNHPDADVLTAFSEQALPEIERASVLAHLAHCTDCREIVALALPAQEIHNLATTTARAPWFTWPILRWAFVAAGIVAVASFGIVQYQHSTRTVAMNSQISQYSEPSATEARIHPPAPVVSEQLEDKEKDKNKNRNEDQQPRANAAILSSNPANGLVNEPNPAARADVSQAPTYQPQTKALTLGRSIGGPLVHKAMGFGTQPQP